MRHAIPHLKVRREFLHVAKGASVARPGVVVQARRSNAANSASAPRAGFTASRKVGNAVVRNRCKRRLRAAVQELLLLYGQPGWDYVFIARAGTVRRRWQALLDDVRTALISVPQKSPRRGKARG